MHHPARSDLSDMVWEPLGGLCSAAVASLEPDCHCRSADFIPKYYALAKKQIEQELALAAPTNAFCPRRRRLYWDDICAFIDPDFNPGEG
jgi:hypothetical protein